MRRSGISTPTRFNLTIKMSKLLVYIASPYTKGDPAANTAVQMDAAHRILDMGHVPIAPLLSHFLHIHRQRPYEDWLEMDLVIIPKCDILLRLPGESAGADKEVEKAKEHGLVVVHGWEGLREKMDVLHCRGGF